MVATLGGGDAIELSDSRSTVADALHGSARHWLPDQRDFGAEIREWADFALSRRGQATRRETGMPRLVMMLMTLQATLASVFCVGKVRA